MKLENYISELKEKDEQYKIKRIVKEYNKEIQFKLKSPAMTKPSHTYFISTICLIGSLTPLRLRSENISLIISAIYIVPSLIFSVMSIILYVKLKRAKDLDIKLFLTVGNFIILEFFGMCFSGTYMLQFFLFNDWGSIDYLTTIVVFIVLLIPVIVVGIRSAPKKFIKQFTQNNIYKNPSEAVVWTSITLAFLVNMTKRYMLVLAVFYGAIIYFTPKFIFVAYKASKYDYIQSLRKG